MWPMMGKELHQSSKVYRETFDRCCDHLEKAHGYTGARQFLTEPDITKYTAVEGVCGLAAVQISLVAMLKEAGLEWEGMFGHSAGETAMGYFLYFFFSSLTNAWLFLLAESPCSPS